MWLVWSVSDLLSFHCDPHAPHLGHAGLFAAPELSRTILVSARPTPSPHASLCNVVSFSVKPTLTRHPASCPTVLFSELWPPVASPPPIVSGPSPLLMQTPQGLGSQLVCCLVTHIPRLSCPLTGTRGQGVFDKQRCQTGVEVYVSFRNYETRQRPWRVEPECQACF